MKISKSAAAAQAATLLLLALLALPILLMSAAATAGEQGRQQEQGQEQEKEYHLKLLAVSEEEGDGEGITADLYLKVTSGTGNVFLETAPVTKLDTRISTRLAKNIACESLSPALSASCDQKDFFFRIEANASIVGGPSAGAAAAALAVAAVDNTPMNESVAITGTISSGAMIGQVGGLKQKIDAAAEAGIGKVLIPSGERYAKTRKGNMSKNASATITLTLDLAEYGKSVGVEVVEVADLAEALLYLTGKSYSTSAGSLEIDKRYSEIMKELAGEICAASTNLSSTVSSAAIAQQNWHNKSEVLNAAKNLTSQGLEEEGKGSYYSAASMCFGANVRYQFLRLVQKNISSSEALLQINLTDAKIDEFKQGMPEAKSLSDLQVRGLVKERLEEAKKLLELSAADSKKDSNESYEDGLYRLAFAKERLVSALAWSRFLTPKATAKSAATSQIAAEDSLRNGCVTKLQEADEHMQYLDIYVPGVLQGKEELGPVYGYLRQKDYASCIYRASIAKAKANAMLSALSGSENITKLVDKKLEAAKASLVRQTAKGEFPIISYSYYEYSNALKNTDQPSALLFSEYALELSSMDVYLKPDKTGTGQTTITSPQSPAAYDKNITYLIVAVVLGFATGAVFALTAKELLKRKKRIIIKRSARTK